VSGLPGNGGTGLPPRVHCVGVAGGGLSVLARLLLQCGHRVSGSDRAAVAPALLRAGLQLSQGAGCEHARAADLLVRSAAVPDDDREVTAARAAGVPVLKYAEALGRIMAGRRGVAVAGTHGKTTSTALVAHLAQHAGLEPAWVVGGLPRGLPACSWGRGEVLVAEACEYDHSFLQLDYQVGVITGVAADHLDCFGDLDGVWRAFQRFAARLPPGGTLVLGPGLSREQLLGEAPDSAYDAACAGALAEAPDASARASLHSPEGEPRAPSAGVSPRGRVVSVDETLRLERLVAGPDGWRGDLLLDDGRRLPLLCPLWGRHNLGNALCALLAVHALGVDWEQGLAGLASFEGVGRRLHDRGELHLTPGASVRLIDDFAHHPDALRAAAEALASHLPGRRRVALFQPHQVSRTEEHLDAFVTALGHFDAVGLCDIFVARDARPERADALAETLAQRAGQHVQRLGPAASADAAARALLRPGDACVVMGAGDIDGLARRLAAGPAGP